MTSRRRPLEDENPFEQAPMPKRRRLHQYEYHEARTYTRAPESVNFTTKQKRKDVEIQLLCTRLGLLTIEDLHMDWTPCFKEGEQEEKEDYCMVDVEAMDTDMDVDDWIMADAPHSEEEFDEVDIGVPFEETEVGDKFVQSADDMLCKQELRRYSDLEYV